MRDRRSSFRLFKTLTTSMLVLRSLPTAAIPSLDVDAGGVFRFFRETSLPATHVAVRYRLFGNRRWSVPFGVRVDMILDDEVTAVPMSFTSGVFYKL